MSYNKDTINSATIIWKESIADPAHIVWITTRDGIQICADNYRRMPLFYRIKLFFVRMAIRFIGRFTEKEYKHYPESLKQANLKYNGYLHN